MESIIVALITGGLSLIGVIITSRSSGKRCSSSWKSRRLSPIPKSRS